jgi:hypothetical protein
MHVAAVFDRRGIKLITARPGTRQRAGGNQQQAKAGSGQFGDE